MGSPNINGIITIRDILSVTQDVTTGTISCNTGNAFQEDKPSETNTSLKSGNMNSQFWQQPGLMSAPSNYNKDDQDAPQAIFLTRGDVDLAIGHRYIKCQSLPGTIGPGDTALYANGSDGTGLALIKLTGIAADSKIQLTTTAQQSFGITITGTSIQLGDSSAKALTYSAAFEALVGAIQDPAVKTAAAAEPGMLKMLANLAIAFAALQTPPTNPVAYATTKVKAS